MLFTPNSVSADGIIPAIKHVGGKGSGLYWLQAHGFPVPPTFVLGTAAFELMLHSAGLVKSVREIDKATAVSSDWAELQRTLDAVEPHRQAVVRALYNVALPPPLQAIFQHLPLHELWAVRSSASVEDTETHSYAGQFLSRLGVPQRGGRLERAVREVWASAFKREVLAYRAQFATPMPRMAVILQPLKPITARERSGVALSQSPVPGMPGVLIQAAFGAGRSVVEGRGGDMYAVQDEHIEMRALPPPSITLTGPDGGEVDAPTPPGLALTADEARRLAAHVQTMAKRWGKPVNVEFVWYANEPEPLFVQIRPISTTSA